MDDVMVVLVIGLLAALLARIYWRVIVNLVVISGIWLIFAAIFFVVMGIDRVIDWT